MKDIWVAQKLKNVKVICMKRVEIHDKIII